MEFEVLQDGINW